MPDRRENRRFPFQKPAFHRAIRSLPTSKVRCAYTVRSGSRSRLYGLGILGRGQPVRSGRAAQGPHLAEQPPSAVREADVEGHARDHSRGAAVALHPGTRSRVPRVRARLPGGHAASRVHRRQGHTARFRGARSPTGTARACAGRSATHAAARRPPPTPGRDETGAQQRERGLDAPAPPALARDAEHPAGRGLARTQPPPSSSRADERPRGKASNTRRSARSRSDTAGARSPYAARVSTSGVSSGSRAPARASRGSSSSGAGRLSCDRRAAHAPVRAPARRRSSGSAPIATGRPTARVAGRRPAAEHRAGPPAPPAGRART